MSHNNHHPLYETETFRIKELNNNSTNTIYYQFPTIPIRGLYLFSANVPLKCSLQSRTIEFELIVQDTTMNVLQKFDKIRISALGRIQCHN
jgi:hypothetical protein